MNNFQLWSLAVATLLRLGTAQESGWIVNQINTTMCQWAQPRVAVVRDTAYIDGGELWWEPGLSDGSYGAAINDGNPKGLVYALNFSIPYHTSDNITKLLTTISKASGGANSNANNIGPNYLDGGMFANDYEWMTYGGLVTATDAFSAQSDGTVAEYQVYSETNAPQFAPSFIVKTLSENVTRYVTYGGAASSPAENLGFYFSGLTSSSGGAIFESPQNESVNADQVSNYMIQVDMSVEGSEKWTNLTLPSEIPGRASAELVWVPTSDQGILVALGGVIDPYYASYNLSNNQSVNDQSSKTSPTFISTIDVYDIAGKVWYQQPTTGGPGTLAQGCTVVASAQDGSSHNIYWYGGFDGINPNNPFNDDVWILSLPSFMWMKVSPGTAAHARAGHKCVKPYPDQMVVIGGYPTYPSDSTLACLDNTQIVQVFNLSSAQWMDSYDPRNWAEYQVPDMIVAMIGGSPTGGATATVPTSTGFASPSMTALFASKYNTTKIQNYYPYSVATSAPTNTTVPSVVPVNKSTTPSYLAPVLAVVLGLFLITLIVLGILLWRRRKTYLQSQQAQSENGTMDNRFWVTNWIRGTTQDHKAATVTTDDTEGTQSSPYDDNYTDTNRSDVQEVSGTQVHEMMDTSVPVELASEVSATGFVPLGAGTTRHTSTASRRLSDRGLTSSPSVTSQRSGTSTVSRDSHSPIGRPPISPIARPDSPSLGDQRGFSGVSVTDSDRGHLRGISETSVSTEGAYATPLSSGQGERNLAIKDLPKGVSGGGRAGVVSPMTPPDQPAGAATDYLNARRSGSPGRKSNFSEELDK